MVTDIEIVFEKYHSMYERIFKNIYPAKGNNAFNEQNQTVLFSKAFEKECGDNSFSWFELNVEKRGRVDAVLFNIYAKEIFIVESKQFWSDKERCRSFRDIRRTLGYEKEVVTQKLKGGIWLRENFRASPNFVEACKIVKEQYNLLMMCWKLSSNS